MWGFDTSRVAASLEATRTAFRGFQSSSVAANLEAIGTAFKGFRSSPVAANLEAMKVAFQGVGVSHMAANWNLARRATLGIHSSPVAANLEAIRTAIQGFQSSPVLDNGWLIELLNDEERIRAAFPLLAASSGTCMILGLLFVALVDPTVRAALEILSDEASLGALIVAVVTLMICERK